MFAHDVDWHVLVRGQLLAFNVVINLLLGGGRQRPSFSLVHSSMCKVDAVFVVITIVTIGVVICIAELFISFRIAQLLIVRQSGHVGSAARSAVRFVATDGAVPDRRLLIVEVSAVCNQHVKVTKELVAMLDVLLSVCLLLECELAWHAGHEIHPVVVC